MRFLRLAIIAFLGGLTAHAAPLPKELNGSKMEKLFGKPSDNSTSCEYKLDENKLRITVPGTVEAAATALKGTPRTTREIAGDFEINVTIYCNIGDPMKAGGGHAGPGLAAWVDDENYALINRHHWPAGMKWSGGFDTHHHWKDTNAVSHGATCEGTDPEKPSLLRLVRQGNKLTTSESRDDGKTWQTTGTIEGQLPAKLQVGVVCHNTTKQKVEMVFEHFDIKETGKK